MIQSPFYHIEKLLEAQDAKSFAAGIEAQKEKGEQRIKDINNYHFNNLKEQVAEAEKRGARELAEWIKKHNIQPMTLNANFEWQSKLKELT